MRAAFVGCSLLLLGIGPRLAVAQPKIEVPEQDPAAPSPEVPSPEVPASPSESPAPSAPLQSPPPPILPPPPPPQPQPQPQSQPQPQPQTPDAALSSTTIGGYGQLDLKYRKVGPDGPLTGQANVRRIVLFIGHRFTDRISTYVEVEWENALACAACQGIAEIEQAVIDVDLAGPALMLRAGLVLVPMGIVNRFHEPPVFNGVDRPSFDQSVIPSTWREIALGIFGRLHGGLLRYELYAMTALDPTRLGPDGIIGGRSSGSLGRADAVAGVGRLEVEPRLGMVLGVSGYASDMGRNGDFYNELGRKLSLHLPVLGWSADGRFRRWGVEARFVAAMFFLPESAVLLQTRRSDGSPYYPAAATTGAVPTRTQGGYVEVGYDVLRLLAPSTRQQLVPFVRAEYYDTQAAVPAGYRRIGAFTVKELTLGLSYRPIPQLVVKGDFQLRDRRYGFDEYQIDFGVGWMF